MSVTQTPPPELAPIESGVIDDARRRQRRRRVVGAWVAAATGVAALALIFTGGGGGGRTRAPIPSRAPQQRLSFVNGLPYVNGQPFPLAVTPSLQAGNVGLCVLLMGSGSCDGPYPGPGRAMYDGGFSPEVSVGREGEIDYELVGPQVVAVRVQGHGTFTPVRLPGLPTGDRVVVFYRPPGSRGTVLPAGAPPGMLRGFGYGSSHPTAVTVTPLDRAGRALPTHFGERPLLLANDYWQPPDIAPANGRCALASHTPGASVQWGQVATKVTPDRAANDAQFLTCLQMWFNVPGGAFQAAVLLNARSPGRPPAALWGATPVPGHPGLVKIDARTYRPASPGLNTEQLARDRGDAFAARTAQHPIPIQSLTVARRVGPAWLLVINGGSLTQEIGLLNHLTITHLRLR